jgi:hypothetical protein
MKISEVIQKLLDLEKKHGDLLCVTCGLDGSGFNDISHVQLITDISDKIGLSVVSDYDRLDNNNDNNNTGNLAIFIN